MLKPALRRRLIEIRQHSEQTIDRHTLDEVLYAGFDAQAVDKARAKVKDFRAWIEANRDRFTALQLIYAGTRPLKLTLGDLRQLRDALAHPPLAATPVQLWRAYQAIEGAAVAEPDGDVLTNLVSLVRHALMPTLSLVPYRRQLRERYRQWLAARDASGATFTAGQREWLDRMAEHIATSLAIERDDFDSGWFGQHGGLGGAHALFGAQLQPLMDEMNERLAA